MTVGQPEAAPAKAAYRKAVRPETGVVLEPFNLELLELLVPAGARKILQVDNSELGVSLTRHPMLAAARTTQVVLASKDLELLGQLSSPRPDALRQAPRGGQGNLGAARRFLERADGFRTCYHACVGDAPAVHDSSVSLGVNHIIES